MSNDGRERTAEVLWWDTREVHVFCPWCSKIHRHGYSGEYRGQLWSSHCSPSQSRTSTYKVHFLVDLPHIGYEIDKQNLRFVTKYGLEYQKGILSGEDAKTKREHHKANIARKPKWTAATLETVFGENLTMREIDVAELRMVHGELDFVKHYLESSAEASIFLHGVGSKPHSGNFSASDGNDAVLLPHPVKDTRGKTALHLAAAGQHPAMVRLLASKGANVDAADLDGITPLMEAAFWGRPENVRILLRHGADRSLQCIHKGRLNNAADFAKRTDRTAMARGGRAGDPGRVPTGREHAHVRDCEREEILWLLCNEMPTATSRGPGRMRGEHQGSDGRSLFPLTQHVSLLTESKTMARLHRGPNLPEVDAMSGSAACWVEGAFIPGHEWTDKVINLSRAVGFKLQPHNRDDGVPGHWEACHAEKRLAAYFVDHHCALAADISLLEEMVGQQEEEEVLAGGFRAQERQEARQEEEMAAWRQGFQDLWAIVPEHRLQEATITVNRPVCVECKRFVAHVNKAAGIALSLRHACLEKGCRECSD
ncbi:hypothetical protein LLEC1_02597 [Akanthomyces lecanii]|uniref:Single-strand DNA deaminase toxin A-like C-terminal domain-containing protein n=1 Tax=Cordyceps confragosa TaxID=2714763 RepID=A0A179II87_CORDF|nr:hypothetical protein LLEC1_02597 [Akanthomyces lecanii]